MNSFGGLVYSTDPNFKPQNEDESEAETLLPAQQKLVVRLDSKRRAGKVVTLIEGFQGKEKDLVDLEKRIKTYCGTGGSAKDGEIIIQGENILKIIQWLNKNGFTSVKRK